ncbi:hypothetical protein BpHYR1_025614 [Brachionus plicatilis]|uniref:Uncharacterized protein n=1 Tax=Brachionus plicatilis TaxID=10195 RepID=A0A3M7STV4_BRAPC|nr:hypothetical protein BpHYR1_025614 [Brachionus plicatilis]
MNLAKSNVSFSQSTSIYFYPFSYILDWSCHVICILDMETYHFCKKHLCIWHVKLWYEFWIQDSEVRKQILNRIIWFKFNCLIAENNNYYTLKIHLAAMMAAWNVILFWEIAFCIIGGEITDFSTYSGSNKNPGLGSARSAGSEPQTGRDGLIISLMRHGH